MQVYCERRARPLGGARQLRGVRGAGYTSPMMMGHGGGMPFGPLVGFLLLVATAWVGHRLYRRIGTGNATPDTPRTSVDAPTKGAGGASGASAGAPPDAATLYRLARDHSGTLSVSTVVVELGDE
jgi:hypothetical protein